MVQCWGPRVVIVMTWHGAVEVIVVEEVVMVIEVVVVMVEVVVVKVRVVAVAVESSLL